MSIKPREFTTEDAQKFQQAMRGDQAMRQRLDTESRASVTRGRPGENEYGFVPGEVKALQSMFPADEKEGGRKKRRSRRHKSRRSRKSRTGRRRSRRTRRH
jgi:hypothetical protein